MYLGVDYYTEQWPEERWATDARLMREAGLSVVRIGEFAWAKMEPAEGVFDWDWLDRVIEILASEGLHIILCTPTAAPPAWLSYAYPDTLPVNAQGQRSKPQCVSCLRPFPAFGGSKGRNPSWKGSGQDP